jgi:nicotinate phosphoribosyltransferase
MKNNEAYNIEEDLLIQGTENLYKKINLVKNRDMSIPFRFADFGMRRRFSGKWHDTVVGILKEELPHNFIGTSNVYLAKKHKVGHIGTMAHEWLMVGQGLKNVRLADSQKYMFEVWAKEYRGDLGIALSDTLGFKTFLNDFDKYFCKLFDGCRHDSGDPIEWGEKLIEHYEKMGVDPKTKSAVFSDGLTFPLALQLAEYFNGWLKTSYGIGTNLTNDVGFEPLQIVMKVVRVNGNPVAKLSDSSGKGMCEDAEFLQYLKKVFNIC